MKQLTLEQTLIQHQQAAEELIGDYINDPEAQNQLCNLAQISSLTREALERNGISVEKVVEALNYVGSKINQYANDRL